MRYQYRIAGITVCAELPFSLKITKESEQFVRELPSGECSADLTVRFIPVQEIPESNAGRHWEICQYYEQDADGYRVFFCPVRDGKPYACISWKDGEPDAVCHYLKEKESCVVYSQNVLDIIGLEILLRRFHGMILHASYIRWNGRGILFSAPSGTGKSTQADLWAKYEQAEILNGDRAALRLTEDGWRAYGLPYAGSSRIYRNETTGIAAIAVLRQGKENRIRRLSAAEAFVCLFPEITIHRWEKEFVEELSDLLLRLLAEIPVYCLTCLPDRGAVELMKETMIKNREEFGYD